MSGRVLITGATSGIGRQLALDYRRAGWQVWGCGRDGERLQELGLTSLLRETNFTPGASAEALFFPPSKIRAILRLRRGFERLGRILWPAFSGVIVVEAQKRLYQGLPVASRASRRVFAPVLAPQGVPTTRSRSPEV